MTAVKMSDVNVGRHLAVQYHIWLQASVFGVGGANGAMFGSLDGGA